MRTLDVSRRQGTATVDSALETQVRNVEAEYGGTIAELTKLIRPSTGPDDREDRTENNVLAGCDQLATLAQTFYVGRLFADKLSLDSTASLGSFFVAWPSPSGTTRPLMRPTSG
jgi:hypothetical protein